MPCWWRWRTCTATARPGQADDRGSAAGRDHRQGPYPGGDECRVARPPPRPGIGLLRPPASPRGRCYGEPVFGNALAGPPRPTASATPDLPHTYSDIPDITAGLATLGTDDRAVGQARHLPGPRTRQHPGAATIWSLARPGSTVGVALGAQLRPARTRSGLQLDDAGAGRDGLGSTSRSSWTPAGITSRSSGRPDAPLADAIPATVAW